MKRYVIMFGLFVLQASMLALGLTYGLYPILQTHVLTIWNVTALTFGINALWSPIVIAIHSSNRDSPSYRLLTDD